MKLSIVSNKVLGKELAFPIYMDNGVMYLNSGVKLNEKYIKAIQNMKINMIYTNDGIDDIVLKEVLDSRVKIKIIKMIKQEFNSIKALKKVNDRVIKDIIDELLLEIDLSENALFFNNLGQMDDFTKLCVHSLEVCILAIIVGVNKKLNERKLIDLGTAALLHDVGKLFNLGEDHVNEGYNLLKRNYMFSAATYVSILQHHENVDGTGFPEKLKGKSIHELAKIISICDGFFNALTNDMMLLHQAMEKVQAETLRKYDEETYKCFNKSIYLYPVGSEVKLNNNKVGTVILQNKNFPIRPVIMVEYKDGCREYIDLNNKDNLTLFIEEVIL